MKGMFHVSWVMGVGDKGEGSVADGHSSLLVPPEAKAKTLRWEEVWEVISFYIHFGLFSKNVKYPYFLLSGNPSTFKLLTC